ncbi:hypothetical protein L915_08938 [Phytophthora nicotianae]|uniref:Uncharacterized protein n=1 Tax=Phytophthora nicotianae TaxID=4792 RepID=W2GTX7_PHYNI|nr:hypothetical protein L915_08938 [Phytophthora nicotianae]
MSPNREICALFFKTKDQGVVLCQLCGGSRKQQPGSGCSGPLILPGPLGKPNYSLPRRIVHL